MKYVALLRGINVGGNALIKMTALKEEFEKLGFANVKTYIASGNVLFESDEPVGTIRDRLERDLSQKFKLDLKIVLRSRPQLQKALAEVPQEWRQEGFRCYMAFVREPVTSEDVLKEIKLREGVDSVKTGVGVIYMTTKLDGITKSGFSKLAGNKVYKHMTVRNYNTSQRLLALMGGKGT